MWNYQLTAPTLDPKLHLEVRSPAVVPYLHDTGFGALDLRRERVYPAQRPFGELLDKRELVKAPNDPGEAFAVLGRDLRHEA